MTWFKVRYDFKRTNWQAFGHVGFVQAENLDDAHTHARELIAQVEPGATVTSLDVAPSTAAAQQRHAAKVEAHRRWAANVAVGIPNKRSDI